MSRCMGIIFTHHAVWIKLWMSSWQLPTDVVGNLKTEHVYNLSYWVTQIVLAMWMHCRHGPSWPWLVVNGMGSASFIWEPMFHIWWWRWLKIEGARDYWLHWIRCDQFTDTLSHSLTHTRTPVIKIDFQNWVAVLLHDFRLIRNQEKLISKTKTYVKSLAVTSKN